MLKEVMHIGITVSDMDRSIEFYKNILGLKFVGEIVMQGRETDILFGRENSKARVCYLNGSKEIYAPPVELIQFLDQYVKKEKSDLFKTSISEICFSVKDIDKFYNNLLKNNVNCISKPQEFDFTKDGFGKSKALYFKDPDGIILEVMQKID